MLSRVEVITSVERRRRWSRAEKERLVAASFEPGVSVSEVARIAGLHVSQLFRWRKMLCAGSASGFLPVTVAPTPDPQPEATSELPSETPTRRSRIRSPHRAGAIEITLPGGERVRAEGSVDPDLLDRVLAALRAR
ncbi:IS66-like element accessory protein TnpA [Methylobacterium amylolyticum]